MNLNIVFKLINKLIFFFDILFIYYFFINSSINNLTFNIIGNIFQYSIETMFEIKLKQELSDCKFAQKKGFNRVKVNEKIQFT